MTLSNIITFDLLSHYDGKLKLWINNLFYNKTEIDEKETNLTKKIFGKIWSNLTGEGGYFKTKYEHEDGSYALMWNESDGGGAQYFNKQANVVSYIGVNDGADDLYAQIYAKNKATNTGVRINVTPNGAYYNVTNSINMDPSYEIATKGDIVAVLGEIPTSLSAFTNDASFLTETEIDTKISTALTSAVTYRGSVATVNDLPTENLKVGDLYNVNDSDYNYIYNGEGWDITAPIINILTATVSQIESLFP